MNIAQFISMLHQDGYPEPLEVKREPLGQLGDHTHPFEVKALVIEGSIELVVNGIRKQYLSGDIFHLGFEELHSELYGPQGVRYLVSRKE
ncbi:hypothetical protein [Polynucleobacter asymbioticus]|jgi:hypothetical protein|uniref:Cupin n=1 Tax=Polynucleobacter asymbioticus (strain DSM 18221 / CIP 109841 / QLW-P1DMWA-1) TaxID=312153 RepID=A4SYJ6_POLAQ|nr:hypothetical protein [Polynucleobacter asymbioticus]ABP34560.1 conserved hypothetical protein [Polynucleobacter asymbioticus QLW-P1DMWA-1]APC06400.1 cupin [Polynucleobacter asymbioticus]